MTTQKKTGCEPVELFKFIRSQDYPDHFMTLKDYDTNNHVQVVVNHRDANNEKYQRWQLPQDKGNIVAQATTNRGMTIEGTPTNGMIVKNSTLTDSDYQRWKIVQRPMDLVTISPVLGQDLGITIEDNPASGSAVKLTKIPSGAPKGTQLWKLVA